MANLEKELIDFEAQIKVINDIPTRLRKGIFYYIGSMAFMLCPCGCKETIELYSKKHLWTITHYGLTVTPEIHNPICGTRFIIAHGTAYGQAPFPPPKKRKSNVT